jgi:SHS family lactate transporter-like MFS transporter
LHGGNPEPFMARFLLNIKPRRHGPCDAVGGNAMAIVADAPVSIAWWKEPTKDQWLAWIAGWLGWMLDAFDFTIFLLIMVPIANEFGVSVTAVAAVLTFTLWLRLVGATASGWLADRIGRKAPLMLSIVWFSACNFIAGFSPNFTFLFVVRAVLGIGMGGEWPAGATLALETWPARSRGLMSAVLQGSWGLGFALSSVAYWLLFDEIGWRGLLWLAILPAPLVCVYIRYFVKEPEVWVENRKRQREQKQDLHAPLVTIFKPALLRNTLTACWWMSGVMVVYFSIYGLFATWLQSELKLDAAVVATPILLANLGTFFFAAPFWGRMADSIGRRGTIIITALIGCIVAPAYLLTNDLTWIMTGFVIQGLFGGAVHVLNPTLTERFPTEVRATASGFCYHFGAIFGGLVPPVISYFAVEHQMGFAVPMLIGTLAGAASVIIAVLISPETKGKVFVSDLMKQ